MLTFSRREFLKISARLAAWMGVGITGIPRIADALERLASGPPVIWIQGQSCSGCSVSFLNSDHPDPVQILTQHIALQCHSTLSTATGEMFMDVLHNSIDRGGYFLVVEGAVPAGMPEACKIGHELITDQIKRAANHAKGIIAIGACASFGGIPAAENNPTGAVGVADFLKSENISKDVIRIPGCPAHPDWFVGTLVHLLAFDTLALDELGRPNMFYSRYIHEQCPRFADYEREFFAKHFSDDGCLFKLGCLGPITQADCTRRYWNSGINSCIPAGGPCIGCASPEFASKASFPFYRIHEHSSKKEG